MDDHGWKQRIVFSGKVIVGLFCFSIKLFEKVEMFFDISEKDVVDHIFSESVELRAA